MTAVRRQRLRCRAVEVAEEWQGDAEDVGEDVPDLKTCMARCLSVPKRAWGGHGRLLLRRLHPHRPGGGSRGTQEPLEAPQVWVCAGNEDQRGLCGTQAVLLSSSFVRDAFRGILRVRVLSVQGLRNVTMAGAVAVYFRTSAGQTQGGLQGFQRNSVRRGVLNGLAEWLDEERFNGIQQFCRRRS